MGDVLSHSSQDKQIRSHNQDGDVLISDLFISYANCQFNKSPDYFNYFLEEVEAFNTKVYFQIANYSEEEFFQTMDDPNSIHFEDISDFAECAVSLFGEPIPDIFQKVSNLLQGEGNSASDFIFTTTEYKQALLERNIASSLTEDINCIVLDGIFYSQYGETQYGHQGCLGCAFNQTWERHLINKKNVTCINCHQEYLKETLDRIIDAENLYDIGGIYCLIEAMNQVVARQVFVRKKGTLEEYSWVKNHLLTGQYDSNLQQLSQFVWGCLGYSLISFLREDSKNVLKIKKCKICNNYFISSKADPRIKKCRACYGKLTKEENRKKKKQERTNKKEQNIKKKFRECMSKLRREYTTEEIKQMGQSGKLNKIIEEYLLIEG